MNPPSLLSAEQIESVRTGQKIVIWAILLNIAIYLTQILTMRGDNSIIGLLMIVLGLFTFVLSIVGIVKMSGGMGYHIALRVLLAVLMIVPCVSLIVLLVLSIKSTNILKAHGYKVGLLGAEKKD
jgi:succinate-acetate transporter protein